MSRLEFVNIAFIIDAMTLTLTPCDDVIGPGVRHEKT
jgi:hypothetical protein